MSMLLNLRRQFFENQLQKFQLKRRFFCLLTSQRLMSEAFPSVTILAVSHVCRFVFLYLVEREREREGEGGRGRGVKR